MDERNTVTKPALNVWTLAFRDPDMENAYRLEAARQSLPMLRFGLSLAILLYLLFGFLDYWLLPASFWLVAGTRAGVALLLAAVLACSYSDFFERWRALLVCGVSLAVAASIIFFLHLVAHEIGDSYYPGLFLLIYGTYALVGLRFTQSSFVSGLSVAGYLAYELIVAGRQDGILMVNTVFLLGATIIASVGGYTTEYLRRLSFFQRQLIERDRERSHYLALHDTLTGLANRRLETEHLQQALARAGRYKSRCGLLFMDLDGFKQVNDSLGHDVGDRLLVAVAGILRKISRDVDLVSRLGGDEFVIVMEGVRERAEAELLAKRIHKAFRKPLLVDGHELRIGASIGLSIYPEDGDTPAALMSAADRAMYAVKRESRASAA